MLFILRFIVLFVGKSAVMHCGRRRNRGFVFVFWGEYFIAVYPYIYFNMSFSIKFHKEFGFLRPQVELYTFSALG